MSKIVLYLLGQKGYQVLNMAVTCGYKQNLALVILGTDRNVQQDYSSEIINLCIAHGIEYYIRDAKELTQLNITNYIAIAAGWRWLITAEYRQIIVFHDSLLPKYRGFNPLVTALLNQDKEIGVTAIIAGQDFDRGDIVENISIQLTYPTTIAIVTNQVSQLYFELAQSIFDKLIQNKILIGSKQDDESASYSVWRDNEDYRINWGKPAEYILHFINCLSFPYKGASTILEGKILRVWDAQVVPDVVIANRDVGKVLFNIEHRPVVICGNGLLRILAATDDFGEDALPFKNFRTRLL